MTRMARFISRREDEDAAANRQTESLAALAVLLLLVVVGVFLARTLESKAAVEDCLLAGGHNCDAVLISHPLPRLW